MVVWTPERQLKAEEAAKIRIARKRTQGHRYNRPAGHHTYDDELQATAAEIWVAIHTGVEASWQESGQRDKGVDVIPDLGVRHSKYARPHLIVHDEDSPNLRYVSVGGTLPNLRVWGWMWGHEAQNREKYWGGPYEDRPCYWVPLCDLTPLPEANGGVI